MVIITTLIELFDECQIENIIAGLSFEPEKIVFIGFKETMTQKRINALEKFFEMKKLEILLEYEVVGRYDYKSITERLNYILDKNEDCVFDLTGGKELVLTAMGEVSTTRNIPMLQFDVQHGKLIAVKNLTEAEKVKNVSMTIEESIVLNGGAVYKGANDVGWDLNEDFIKDIEIMWNICRKDCREWNRQSAVFENFENFGRISDGFAREVNLGVLRERKKDTYLSERIIKELIRNGLIHNFRKEGNAVSFSYKNAQVHRCISKAGNILELYVYMLFNEMKKRDNSICDDIDIGIFADWDGIIHDEKDRQRDTQNEIDVMLTKNLLPVFISCKNGIVRKEALYELKTVAEKFGGEYAKMVLISTYISIDEASKSYILQRAKDMKIKLISGVEKLEKNEFLEILASI